MAGLRGLTARPRGSRFLATEATEGPVLVLSLRPTPAVEPRAPRHPLQSAARQVAAAVLLVLVLALTAGAPTPAAAATTPTPDPAGAPQAPRPDPAPVSKPRAIPAETPGHVPAAPVREARPSTTAAATVRTQATRVTSGVRSTRHASSSAARRPAARRTSDRRAPVSTPQRAAMPTAVAAGRAAPAQRLSAETAPDGAALLRSALALAAVALAAAALMIHVVRVRGHAAWWRR